MTLPTDDFENGPPLKRSNDKIPSLKNESTADEDPKPSIIPHDSPFIFVCPDPSALPYCVVYLFFFFPHFPLVI